MSAADALPATLRGDVIDIVLGTVFLSVGATACAIAGGIFSVMYGLQALLRAFEVE
jgi:hypothetical protein